MHKARRRKMTVDVDAGKKAEDQPGYVAQLQATLNVIPAHTWYASPSGGLTFVNKRTADYLGLPKDHPLRFGIDVGAQWDAHLPFVHPDDRAETQENWSTRLRTGEGGEGSFRVRNAQGGYRWFLSRAEPLRASDGTILQWVGVNLDIEDVKCAEQALRESERSARSAIDGIAGLVAIMTPNGEVETVNRQCLEYFGRSLEDLKSWEISDTVHPEDLPHMLELFKRAIASEIPYDFEQRLRRFDGEYRWFATRGGAVRDGTGRIARWYVLLTDIEERKRAELALKKSEAELIEARRELQATIDKIPALVASLWPNGERDFVNLAWQRFTGISQEEARGTTQMIPLHPDHRGLDASDWQRCLETGEPFEQEEQLLR